MLPIALGAGAATAAGFSLRNMDKPAVIDSPLHREWMLQQELLLALDGLARLEPELFSGSLTLLFF